MRGVVESRTSHERPRKVSAERREALYIRFQHQALEVVSGAVRLQNV
jgi:hypothetical protein